MESAGRGGNWGSWWRWWPLWRIEKHREEEREREPCVVNISNSASRCDFQDSDTFFSPLRDLQLGEMESSDSGTVPVMFCARPARLGSWRHQTSLYVNFTDSLMKTIWFPREKPLSSVLWVDSTAVPIWMKVLLLFL